MPPSSLPVATGSHIARTPSRAARAARRSLDLTQAETARRAGCARETISRFENDHQQLSSPVAVRLAAVLELGPFDLLTVSVLRRPRATDGAAKSADAGGGR
ncbi:MAG: helix-turn-helix transcriptional regulator [Solirubrobacteraceae bacterium]